ncbi:Pimeloyl-ACP methyl ester carboxylesterase [Pseudoxanthomonas sp. GM95]|uniref:alpha/beta fold hydrolase n=1 Tax=Pseudoxanthomonas sp. GM95 TaxID=1881043 RepID=UPI0008BFD373|nr:alpha/beta fold hydrolase [Pseudoxanthomonas sp. GM95]SEM25896.1 Pimeloyl-ACP methyl ester carboxylesterase [Pseudoxanthomonas sp. GM95]
MSQGRPDLVLLPGLLNDAELWRAQLDGLADLADCHVGDLTQGDSLHAVAQQVLDRAPPTFALAGFSLGGYVAQDILRIAPQRVQRLALLDTSYQPDTPARAQQRRAQEAAVRKGAFHGFGDALMRAYTDASHHDDAVLMTRIRSMTQRLGAEVFLRQSAFEREDGSDVLRAFDAPALVLVGEHDGITPPALHEQMAALLPDAVLVQVPHCGHLSPMEQPAAVSAALREWLLR